MRDNVQLSPKLARTLLVLAFALLALWTLFGLDRPIGDGDEAFNAEVLRQMLRTGDVLHMRWYGVDLHERPPLTYWLALPFAAISSSEIGIRLSSALLSFVTLLLTYRISVRLFSQPLAALTGTILLAGEPSYHDYTRTLMSEAPYLVGITLALWGSLLALRDARGLLLAAAGLGVCFAVRSFGGALPLLALAPWLLWAYKQHGDLRTLLRAGAIFLALALPYFVISYLADPEQFVNEHIGFHLVKRLHGAETFGISGGPLAYVYSIIQRDGPWVVLWISGSLVGGFVLALSGRSPQRQALLLLCTYTLLFFGAMSVIGTRIPHYILPIYPALALLSSAVLAHVIEHWTALWRVLVPALATWMLVINTRFPGGHAVLFETPYGKMLGTKARQVDPHAPLYVYEWYGMALGYYADRRIVLLTSQPARFKALNLPGHALARAHVAALVPPLPAAPGQRILIAGHVNDLSHASWFKVDDILAAAPPYFLAHAVVEAPAADSGKLSRVAPPH